MAKRSLPGHGLSPFCVTVGLLLSLYAGESLAYVREAPSTAYINTNPTVEFAQRAFGPNGYFSLAGGVVFNGLAKFYLENASGAQAVSPSEVELRIDRTEKVYLSYRGTLYQLETHKGAVCPLGQFIARNGLIAFTIPPDVPSASEPRQERLMKGAGLVPTQEGLLAREFLNTRVEGVVVETDFAHTEDLPRDLNTVLVQNINGVLGRNRALDETVEGSYMNTDSIVTYQVYLVAQKGRVEVAGVPLRYFWDHAKDGSAIVKSVEVFSTKWPAGAHVADLPVKEPTSQYDYIILYQTSGVFRQVAISNPGGFKGFVAKACGH